ncbi:hypothetical protein B0H11DRAFT_2365631 [Mycena galericulata]|nr:hypothetical protein B0H11DRAFT_2365631 [Mycena galericulata]
MAGNKKNSSVKKEVQKFEKRQLVLAKVKGFRWWPAMVVDPDAVPSKVTKQRPRRKTRAVYAVKFFAEENYAWLGPNSLSSLTAAQICSFVETAATGPSVRKGLVEAYKEASDSCVADAPKPRIGRREGQNANREEEGLGLSLNRDIGSLAKSPLLKVDPENEEDLSSPTAKAHRSPLSTISDDQAKTKATSLSVSLRSPCLFTFFNFTFPDVARVYRSPALSNMTDGEGNPESDIHEPATPAPFLANKLCGTHGLQIGCRDQLKKGNEADPVVKIEVDIKENMNHVDVYEVEFIEVDKDMLRTIHDCVNPVFEPDGVCEFCVAQYPRAPSAMIDASEEERAGHCQAVHPQAWDMLRHNV